MRIGQWGMQGLERDEERCRVCFCLFSHSLIADPQKFSFMLLKSVSSVPKPAL